MNRRSEYKSGIERYCSSVYDTLPEWKKKIIDRTKSERARSNLLEFFSRNGEGNVKTPDFINSATRLRKGDPYRGRMIVKYSRKKLSLTD